MPYYQSAEPYVSSFPARPADNGPGPGPSPAKRARTASPPRPLTNEEIVAELGWTRKAIQSVLGVTPVTMRPPYGDIDDRVRAIPLAMGMVPIIWTRGKENNQFDTNGMYFGTSRILFA